MKKILVIINNLGFGGAERLVVDDINEMLKLGYKVRLLTLRKEPVKNLAGECKIEDGNKKLIHFENFFNFSSWLKTYKYIKQEKPDVIFSHLWFANAVARVICKRLNFKNLVIFEHNVYDAVKNWKMYSLDKLLQGWCKKIIAVSGAVRTSLIKHGIKKEMIVVVNNGIDIVKYKKNFNPNLKRELGVPENTFIFFTIGRLIDQKGMDILIEAFSKVKIEKEAILLIVGQGEKKAEPEKLCRDLDLSNSVKFLGIRDDIPDLFATSDVFVLASRYEGLGIVILEAMAAKKPIIISDFEAGKDMIDDGENGLIVKVGDKRGLADAMLEIMTNELLRQKLSEAAYEKVKEFSIQGHVKKILELAN